MLNKGTKNKGVRIIVRGKTYLFKHIKTRTTINWLDKLQSENFRNVLETYNNKEEVYYTRKGLEISKQEYEKIKDKPRRCKDCEDKFSIDDLIIHDGEHYCRDCLINNHNFEVCSDCGKLVQEDDYNYLEYYNKTICNDCINDYYKCHDCGDYFTNDDVRSIYVDGSEEDYCHNCRSNLDYFECDGCGGLYHTDYLNVNDDDNCCCHSCYESSMERQSSSDKIDYGKIEQTTFNELKIKRTFGVELETEKKYQFNTPFTRCYDGSIDGDEYVSPVLIGDSGLEAIRTFCRDVKRNNSVNSKCGYHLHIGASDYTYKDTLKLLTFMLELEQFFFKLVSPSRRASHFCRSLYDSNETFPFEKKWDKFKNRVYLDSKNEFKSKWSTDGLSRYYWLNLHPLYEKKKTIEIRLHQGTLDEDKINNWVKLWVSVIEYVKNKSPNNILSKAKGVKNKDDFFRLLAIITRDSSVVEFYKERWLDLNNKEESYLKIKNKKDTKFKFSRKEIETCMIEAEVR